MDPLFRRRRPVPARGGGFPLPVVTPRPRPRMARWRAASLVGVYVLMAAHITHWLASGRTLSPLVLSDSMKTLETGAVNAGFLFFAVIILTTAVFGRFLCGWGCHMAGLQELCAWLMRRVGVRPVLFRSRLLAGVPYGLAFYMFIWPTLEREAVAPLLAHRWPGAAAWLRPAGEFPGFSSALTTTHLWDGLPSAAVSVAFLLVCGFATVYFLGARGLCRYGCPYGGVLAPVGQLAPGRIVVDPPRCDGCGLCTGACGTGIRVHEEVRAYGMVTSNRCVRSMDCVSVCPRGALSFRFARPAILRGRAEGPRPRVKYDLAWPEELGIACVFLGSFFALRGLYGIIPMLMAASLAACAGAVLWKTSRLAWSRDVRFGPWLLKRGGRLRGAGWAFAAFGLATAGVITHSGVIRLEAWRGDRIDGRVGVPRESVLSGVPIPAETRETAGRALAHYRRASSWRRGGWGLADTPRVLVRVAWLHLVRGETGAAESALARTIDLEGPNDQLCAELARVIILGGEPGRAMERLGPYRERAGYVQVRDVLAGLYLDAGFGDEAAGMFERVVAADPGDALAYARLGVVRAMTGRVAEGEASLRKAVALAPREPRWRVDLARVLLATGRAEAAASEFEAAAHLDPSNSPALRAQAAQIRGVGAR